MGYRGGQRLFPSPPGSFSLIESLIPSPTHLHLPAAFMCGFLKPNYDPTTALFNSLKSFKENENVNSRKYTIYKSILPFKVKIYNNMEKLMIYRNNYK